MGAASNNISTTFLATRGKGPLTEYPGGFFSSTLPLGKSDKRTNNNHQTNNDMTYKFYNEDSYLELGLSEDRKNARVWITEIQEDGIESTNMVTLNFAEISALYDALHEILYAIDEIK